VVSIEFTTTRAGFAPEGQAQVVSLCTEGTAAHTRVEKLLRATAALYTGTGE